MSSIKDRQLSFYKARTAGCVFVAICAKNPTKYGWYHSIIHELKASTIDNIVETAIADEKVSTQSLIFPDITTNQDIVAFVTLLQNCKTIKLELDQIADERRCFGFRVILDDSTLSWVSGFANYDFLPKTRQAPFLELVFRVKPRPHYESHMKPPIEGVVHLADTDMLTSSKRVFRKWWNASFSNTKRVLGHKPDLHSAAKTTFSIPTVLFDD